MIINITEEATKQLNELNIKDIRIIYHGQGCGGPVLSMVRGQPDLGEMICIVQDIKFALKQELVDKFEIIDINYCNDLDGGFTVEADNCGGCIRCNGCWLNTVKTDFNTHFIE